jgi:hypothetical protein
LLARTPSSKGGLGCKAYCLHSLVHELALCLAASVYGVALANESRHAATVDMPEVITLTHASPDTWNTLPPVQPKPAVIGSIPMIGDGIGSVMRVRLTGDGQSITMGAGSLIQQKAGFGYLEVSGRLHG